MGRKREVNNVKCKHCGQEKYFCSELLLETEAELGPEAVFLSEEVLP